MTDIRKVVVETILAIAEENELEIVSSFEDETVLLDSGLDEPVYPRTLGEFVATYEKFSKKEA